MKSKFFLLIVVAMFMAGLYIPSLATAAFDSGSDRSDGDFAPTANTVLQVQEDGVFNFTTVNIPSGVTVTFKKNSKNTPVTILAQGNVTVAGTISLNGANGSNLIPGAAAPGAYNGGTGGILYQVGKRGEGPGSGGGGSPRTNDYWAGGGGGGGGYSTSGGVGGSSYSAGGSGGGTYGNERILPLIGGSGGGGGGGTNSYVGGGGGGGGGSILIASSGTINVSGTITANGGRGSNGQFHGNSCDGGGGGGGGSGGSIRLVANVISGNGSITAAGGDGGSECRNSGGAGGAGRIRLETAVIERTSGTNPAMSLLLGEPQPLNATNLPTLTITSIAGVQVPADPRGTFGSPDVTLPFSISNPVTVIVTGTNIPVGTAVTVKTTPSVGTPASATGTLAGSYESTSTSISLTISTNYPSVLMASVTLVVTAANGGPIYADGEKVEKMRIETAMGGGSTIIYITESGREIPAKQAKS